MTGPISLPRAPPFFASIVIALSLGSSCDRNEPVSQGGPSALAVMAESLLSDSAGVECYGGDWITIVSPPVNRYVYGRGCRSDVGDTTRFVYRDTSGQILVVGRIFSVPARHLNGMVEALRADIARGFGGGTDCSRFWRPRSTTVRQFEWEAEGYIMRLWADSLSIAAQIGVEAQRGELLCGKPVQRPVAH